MLTHWTCGVNRQGALDHGTARLEHRSQVDDQLESLRSLAQRRADLLGCTVDYSLRYWWDGERGGGSSVTGSKSPRV